MKLRTRGNSIRLRLTQGEVARLHHEGAVSEVIEFVGTALAYSIRTTTKPQVYAEYRNNEICVYAPSSVVKDWAESDTVGFEHEMDLGQGKSLKLLVEKDFTCLKPRSDEDESDNFPNPNSSCC